MSNKKTKSAGAVSTSPKPFLAKEYYSAPASIDGEHCVWCLNGSYDEIDYIEERLSTEGRCLAKQLGVMMRNRYNVPECERCRGKKREYKLDDVVSLVLDGRSSDESGSNDKNKNSKLSHESAENLENNCNSQKTELETELNGKNNTDRCNYEDRENLNDACVNHSYQFYNQTNFVYCSTCNKSHINTIEKSIQEGQQTFMRHDSNDKLSYPNSKDSSMCKILSEANADRESKTLHVNNSMLSTHKISNCDPLLDKNAKVKVAEKFQESNDKNIFKGLESNINGQNLIYNHDSHLQINSDCLNEKDTLEETDNYNINIEKDSKNNGIIQIQGAFATSDDNSSRSASFTEIFRGYTDSNSMTDIKTLTPEKSIKKDLVEKSPSMNINGNKTPENVSEYFSITPNSKEDSIDHNNSNELNTKPNLHYNSNCYRQSNESNNMPNSNIAINNKNPYEKNSDESNLTDNNLNKIIHDIIKATTQTHTKSSVPEYNQEASKNDEILCIINKFFEREDDKKSNDNNFDIEETSNSSNPIEETLTLFLKKGSNRSIKLMSANNTKIDNNNKSLFLSAEIKTEEQIEIENKKLAELKILQNASNKKLPAVLDEDDINKTIKENLPKDENKEKKILKEVESDIETRIKESPDCNLVYDVKMPYSTGNYPYSSSSLENEAERLGKIDNEINFDKSNDEQKSHERHNAINNTSGDKINSDSFECKEKIFNRHDTIVNTSGDKINSASFECKEKVFHNDNAIVNTSGDKISNESFSNQKDENVIKQKNLNESSSNDNKRAELLTLKVPNECDKSINIESDIEKIDDSSLVIIEDNIKAFKKQGYPNESTSSSAKFDLKIICDKKDDSISLPSSCSNLEFNRKKRQEKNEFEKNENIALKLVTLKTLAEQKNSSSLLHQKFLREVMNSHTINLKINKVRLDDEGKQIKCETEQQIKKIITPESEFKISTASTSKSDKNFDDLPTAAQKEKINNLKILAEERIDNKALYMSNITKSPKYIKRFVIPSKDKVSHIDDIVAINDLKLDIIIGKIMKKGRNELFQNNWFQLKDTTLSCFNGRKHRICEDDMPHDRNGDIICPDDKNFFLTKKYALHLKTASLYLILNPKERNIILAKIRCKLFKSKKEEEKVNLTDKSIKNVTKLGDFYKVYIKNSDDSETTYSIPHLEVAINLGNEFHNLRFDSIGRFLKWILAIELRQQKVVWPIP